MSRLRRALLASLMAGLLAACSTVEKGPASAENSISGRMSVHVPGASGAPARSVSASFELQGTPSAGQLNLSSPLGTVMAQAKWSPQQATLTTSEGQKNFASLDELTVDMLGESLPVAALFDWLRGRPWSDAPSELHDSGFLQLGWSVDTGRLHDGWVMAQRRLAPSVVVRARVDP